MEQTIAIDSIRKLLSQPSTHCHIFDRAHEFLQESEPSPGGRSLPCGCGDERRADILRIGLISLNYARPKEDTAQGDDFIHAHFTTHEKPQHLLRIKFQFSGRSEVPCTRIRAWNTDLSRPPMYDRIWAGWASLFVDKLPRSILDADIEDPPVASLSLTHVHYDPTDPLSHFCAFLALVPQGLIVAYVALCWSSREIEIILAFIGQLACEAVNFTLKRIIQEERPRQIRGKGYGMPSSHSQFMAFFAVYIGMFVLVRHQPKPRRGSGLGRDGSYGVLSSFMPNQYTQQVLTVVVIVVNAAMVAASRIYLNYHTPKQVVVGCAAGAVFGVVWFVFTGLLRSLGVLDWVLDTELARLFRVRDLLLDEDLVESGYREYLARREPGKKAEILEKKTT